MIVVDILPSTAQHVRDLSSTMRDKDKLEAISSGLEPHKALFYAYKHALYRNTAIINGRVGAMWGVVGTPLGITGQPYLVTGKALEELSPHTFAKLYKQEVQKMKALFPVLENYVDASYEGAVRMLKIAGFTLSEPFQDHRFQTAFQKFTLKSEI